MLRFAWTPTVRAEAAAIVQAGSVTPPDRWFFAVYWSCAALVNLAQVVEMPHRLAVGGEASIRPAFTHALSVADGVALVRGVTALHYGGDIATAQRHFSLGMTQASQAEWLAKQPLHTYATAERAAA